MKKSNRICIIIMMLLNILIQPVSEIITVNAEDDLSSNIIEAIESTEVENSLITEDYSVEDNVLEENVSVFDDEKIETSEIIDEVIEEENIIQNEKEENNEENAPTEDLIEEEFEEQAMDSITSLQYIPDYSPNTNLNIGSTSFYKFKLTNLEAVIQNATIKLYIPKSNIDTYNDVASYFPDQGFRERTKVYTENESLVVELSVGNLSNSYYQEFVFSFQTIDDGTMTNDTYIPVRAEVISQNEILAETGSTSFHYQSRKPISTQIETIHKNGEINLLTDDNFLTEDTLFATENLPKVNNTSKPPIISLFEIKDETDAGPYFSGNELVFRTTLGLTEESGSLSESVLEIRIPKDSNKILESSIRASDFNISQGPAEIDSSDPDAYIIRYNLNIINSGTTASVPIVFNTNVGYIPDGYNLPITARLLDTNGEELATSNTSVQFKTANLSMTKYVKNNSNSFTNSNNLLINAGKEDPDNPGYLSENIEHLKPIEFAYRITGPSSDGRRYYNKFEVTDELPEGAIFIQDDNPGWVYDEENHRATFLVESNANSGAGILMGSISQTSTALPKLKLYFPGAKIDQPDTLTNNVNIISHPFEQGELESVQNTNDDITFRLTATPENTVPVTLSASKSSTNFTTVDVLSRKENHEYRWNLTLSNQSNGIGHEPTDLENIVIDDHTLDEALYFNRLSIDRRTISQFDGELSLKVTFDDGTSEIVSNNISITNGTFNADFNHYEKLVTAFEVRSNEGSILKPGTSIRVTAYSKFKDPESVTTPTPSTTKTMRNTADFSANFMNGSTLTLTNRYTTVLLTPYNPRAYLTKSVQSGSQTYFLDDEISYRLALSKSNFYTGETMTDVVVLDLLPLGFEYVNNSTTGNLSSYFDFSSNNRNFPEPELIHNYQGTGRTALLWNLGNIISNYDSAGYTRSSNLNYKIRITDLALAGTHTNEAYFGWSNNDHITVSSRSNDDIFDINENGSVTDKISKHMSNIQYAPPETLIVSKSVKGNLDINYLLPPANANAEIGTDASYVINVFNNSPVDVNTLTLLDVLPHVGDTTVGGDLSGVPSIRGSEFPVTLTGPISLPEGYTVYYTSDEPSGDSVSYTTNANWSTSVSDFSMVKGIKIVLDESHILKKQEGFSFTIPISIPKDESLVNNLQTVNSIGQSLTTQYIYTESNNATLKIVRYKVNGHVFQDLDKNGYYDDTESPFANHIVTLVDEAGNVVTDLDGNPYSVKTDSNGYFEMDVFRQGNYRIKVENPKGHLVTILPDNQGGVPNHIIDDTSKTTDIFTLSPSNREVNRNAGFYVETTSLEVTKVWKDNNNEFGNRPESITINVMANGDFYASYTIEGNEQDKWVKTITNLPLVNKNGEDVVDVVYTLEEVSVNQYDSVIDNENYIITNTYNPSFISINVEKVWNDFDNQDGKRPSYIDVQLLANGEPIGSIIPLYPTNNWKYSWNNLPEFQNSLKIVYTVAEVNVPAGYTSLVKADDTGNILIENHYTPETRTVEGTKV
ncbi:Cna B-type domain-containing protein, partial [Candidatus Saccharibacteria bacterium]|nr:Cna B-type domain-containing protein [Candidatus Saccharibacteria bacterium]